MKTKYERLSRRQFLLGVGAATAATAASVVAKKESVRGANRQQPESQSGYRLTEHIRNYYRTAKI